MKRSVATKGLNPGVVHQGEVVCPGQEEVSVPWTSDDSDGARRDDESPSSHGGASLGDESLS